MPVAIVKTSSMPLLPGRHPTVGGISGTCFYVGNGRYIGANHVFDGLFKPNAGYAASKVYLVSQKKAFFEISKDQVRLEPSLDLAILNIGKQLKGATCFDISTNKCKTGDEITLSGFPIDMELPATFDNKGKLLKLLRDISPETQEGHIESVQPRSLDKPDVKLTNIECVKLSIGGKVGQSGGPICDSQTGEVVALASHGEEADFIIKSKIYGISMGAISTKI